MEFPGHRSREVAVPALLAVVLLQVEHTPEDLEPSWMGYSVGKWQGDTLAVESAGFNGKTLLDTSGHPRSESARMIERYHRRDFGHMDMDLTIYDRKYYTRPFTVKLTFHLIPDSDVLEAVRAENEKDRIHVVN